MGLLLHTWKCFQGFCCLPPFIPAGSLGSANLSPQRLRREGPAHPEPPLGGALSPWRRAQPERGAWLCGDAGSRGRRGLRANAGAGALAARLQPVSPATSGVAGSSYGEAAATGGAWTLDAPGLPPCGVGEERRGLGDFRARRSFPVGAGNLGVRAAGGGGSRRGTQGESPTTGLSPPPFPSQGRCEAATA